MSPTIYITNFNNLEHGFRRLLEWLSGQDVVVLDNGSTYQPLLDYYATLERWHAPVEVIQGDDNLGPYVFWERGLHKIQTERFIVTDPDVVPSTDCPRDLIKLMDRMMENADIGKVGPSLRIDNLPDHFRHKQDVLKWEQQFWDRPVMMAPAYHADIDTTFAMYKPGSEVRNAKPCLRLAPPYTFEHVPWYEDSSQPTAERQYYLSHARKDWIHW